jgi:enterobactin synthetase component D / holo-[acyl-carrier protein] synthase
VFESTRCAAPVMSASMIAKVVPTVAASAELFTDPPDVVVFRAERAAVANAVEKRRLEHGTVRHCARRALSELGYPPTRLLSGERGEPLWPRGIVGAMTHCLGYRAAVVARDRELCSLGIDAEPHAALPHDVLRSVALVEELVHLAELTAADPTVHWDRLLFSCKESIYKAWFPLARRWLGFEDAVVRIDPAANTFSTRLLVAGPAADDGAARQRFDGRWLVDRSLVLTAVTVELARS